MPELCQRLKPTMGEYCFQDRGFTGRLQECYNGVTGILQGGYIDVTGVLQGCFGGLTRVF